MADYTCVFSCLIFVLAILGASYYLWRRNKRAGSGGGVKKNSVRRNVEDVKTRDLDLALEIMQGGKKLAMTTYQIREGIAEHSMKERTYPLVMPPLEFDCELAIQPGHYQLWLLSQRGAAAGLHKVTEGDIKAAVEENKGIEATIAFARQQGKPTPDVINNPLADFEPAQWVEGKTLWELVTMPRLTNKYIGADVLANTLGIMGNRMGLIIGILVGLVVATVANWFIFIILKLLHIF